jgi:hypothetical protein
MLYNLGGNALGTDLLALDELSVVPLPSTFKLDDLAGRDLKEQVQYLFSRRLFELECELAPLLKEKEVLERAVSDREYGWYESDGPVKIGPWFKEPGPSSLADRGQLASIVNRDRLATVGQHQPAQPHRPATVWT